MIFFIPSNTPDLRNVALAVNTNNSDGNAELIA